MTSVDDFGGGGRPALLLERRPFSVGAAPRATHGWPATAVVVALLTTFAAWSTLREIYAAAVALGVRPPLAAPGPVLAGLLVAGLLVPAFQSLGKSQAAREALAAGDMTSARILVSASTNCAYSTLGFAALAMALVGLAQFLLANDMAVSRTFLLLPLMIQSFPLVLKAFWSNVYIFVVAEMLVLVWGLAVAILRLVPGETARPIRLLAALYTDVFRGMPAIITIYLIGFGLPLSGLPLVSNLSANTYAIIALTLTFGAYVAEVYRAGIESIHWSQVAAARSLGLSYLQTMRHVIVPQALRRIVPPLLNDFIGLQKDTALVNIIGAIDAFNQAKIISSNHFNLSAVTVVAFIFVMITIPQARLVDRLLERDQHRRRGG